MYKRQAERTEYRRVDEGQTVHDLFGYPFDNAVKNPHLCCPLTAGEEPVSYTHLAQADLLAIPNMRAYCLLDSYGNIQYLSLIHI